MEYTYSFTTNGALTSFAVSPDAPQLAMTAYKDAATTSLYIDDIDRGLAFREWLFVVCGPTGTHTGTYTAFNGTVIPCPTTYNGVANDSPYEFGLGLKQYDVTLRAGGA